MIDALLNSVLPIFAIVGVGLVLARTGLMQVSAASTINTYLFYVGLPGLGFSLLARTDFRTYDWLALGAYFIMELAVYSAAFCLFRFHLTHKLAKCHAQNSATPIYRAPIPFVPLRRFNDRQNWRIRRP